MSRTQRIRDAIAGDRQSYARSGECWQDFLWLLDQVERYEKEGRTA